MAKKRSRLLDPLPWYPWNPRQWQASRKVQRMTWAARGIYRELMDECWFKRFIPSTVDGLAELLATEPAEVAESLPQFIRCFEVLEDGTMFSPHIERVRTERDAFRLSRANCRIGKVKGTMTEDNAGSPGLTSENESARVLSPDNEGAGGEKRREEKRREEVPPTPLKGDRKRRTRTEIMGAFSKDVCFVANTVMQKGYWLEKDPGGRPIVQDLAKLCSNLDCIFREFPEVSKETLVKAAENYLAKDRQAYRAPQWFYGTGTKDKPADWAVEVRMIQHQASMAAEVSAQGEN